VWTAAIIKVQVVANRSTKDVEGFRAAGSLTWGGIHNTFFWIDLKRRITAVAMMQILPIGALLYLCARFRRVECLLEGAIRK
jgi:CubicO group peptidase (beta-lactamase class C family)